VKISQTSSKKRKRKNGSAVDLVSAKEANPEKEKGPGVVIKGVIGPGIEKEAEVGIKEKIGEIEVHPVIKRKGDGREAGPESTEDARGPILTIVNARQKSKCPTNQSQAMFTTAKSQI
jgi:hypothetical protein